MGLRVKVSPTAEQQLGATSRTLRNIPSSNYYQCCYVLQKQAGCTWLQTKPKRQWLPEVYFGTTNWSVEDTQRKPLYNHAQSLDLTISISEGVTCYHQGLNQPNSSCTAPKDVLGLSVYKTLTSQILSFQFVRNHGIHSVDKTTNFIMQCMQRQSLSELKDYQRLILIQLQHSL